MPRGHLRRHYGETRDGVTTLTSLPVVEDVLAAQRARGVVLEPGKEARLGVEDVAAGQGPIHSHHHTACRLFHSSMYVHVPRVHATCWFHRVV